VRPPCCAAAATLRERDCTPPPHGSVHGVHEPNAVTVQSTGAGVGARAGARVGALLVLWPGPFWSQPLPIVMLDVTFLPLTNLVIDLWQPPSAWV
jgi:hypothetical protein